MNSEQLEVIYKRLNASKNPYLLSMVGQMEYTDLYNKDVSILLDEIVHLHKTIDSMKEEGK